MIKVAANPGCFAGVDFVIFHFRLAQRPANESRAGIDCFSVSVPFGIRTTFHTYDQTVLLLDSRNFIGKSAVTDNDIVLRFRQFVLYSSDPDVIVEGPAAHFCAPIL